MTRDLCLLVAGTLIFWCLVAFPARVLWGESALLFSATAAGLTLVPTAVTLAWCGRVLKGHPHQQLAAVFGGMGFRLLFVVGIGMALFYAVPEFQYQRFWLWVIAFYLVTLTLEIGLLTRRLQPDETLKN